METSQCFLSLILCNQLIFRFSTYNEAHTFLVTDEVLIVIRTYKPRHMTPIELSRSLIGQVSKQERYFRVIVSNLIKDRSLKILYREKSFSVYLISKLSEDEGSDMYLYLMKRRDEYMITVERLIMNQLRVV